MLRTKTRQCLASIWGGVKRSPRQGFQDLHQNKKGKILQSSNLTDVQTKRAFTLAEVLITLGIIGVVASMTIPTLITNYNQRAWDTGATVFNRKLGEALGFMNTQSSLAGFASTKDFVNELSKHIKITKICDSDELTNCFSNEIFTTGDTIDTTTLKMAKNLNSTGDYGTETIGVQFADGVSALIAYNPNATQDPYSNQVVRVTGSGKSVNLDTDAIAILYDVSGNKSPNEYATGKDIRGINASINTGASIVNLGTVSTPVNCIDSTSDGYEYCTADDIELAITSNYWAGAKKACADAGMHLPTIEELQELYTKKGEGGIPTSGNYWSATEPGNIYDAMVFVFDTGQKGPDYKGLNIYNVLCVGN